MATKAGEEMHRIITQIRTTGKRVRQASCNYAHGEYAENGKQLCVCYPQQRDAI